MHRTRFVALTLGLLLTSAAVGRGEEVLLEATHGGSKIASCDILHVRRTCEEFHVIIKAQSLASGLSGGDIVELDGRAFEVTRSALGYYLADGTIVTATSSNLGSAGREWVVVFPTEGQILSSTSWIDSDGNGVLGPRDQLQFETGEAIKVRDVRPLLWVSEEAE